MKKLFILISAMVLGCFNYAYAAGQDCPFPRHVTVVGPKGMYIQGVSPSGAADFYVANKTDSSFDLVAKSQCAGREGTNGVFLTVAIKGNSSFSRVILILRRDGSVEGDTYGGDNYFHFDKVNVVDSHDIQVSYQ